MPVSIHGPAGVDRRVLQRMGNVSTASDREIDRPLGNKPRKPSRRLALPGGKWAVGGLAVLVLLGVSAAIALREQPFRMPSAVAVSTPEAVGEPSSTVTRETEAVPRVDQPGGPSIIRVGPQNVDDSQSVIVIRNPTALNQDARTAHLPDRALIEDSQYGPLPVRSADGRRPFDVYARPWSGARGARVAIVIGGLGLSQTGTQAAIERLPSEVTLAFAPHGNSIDRWMQAARRDGHEIVLQIPLEPFDFPAVNPGRDTLTLDSSASDNIDSLLRTLGRITNYVGVMNYMGARFTAEEAAMSPLMAELGRRGLMYLDDGTSARSVAERLAPGNGVPFAAAEITIDANRDRSAILGRLDDLERTARAQGFAIGTGSAFDTTVEAVTTWVTEARRRGIEIVPISALANDPGR